jgi:hypothetical protein
VTDTGRLAWTDGTKPLHVNHAHHPEELLRGDADPPDELLRGNADPPDDDDE